MSNIENDLVWGTAAIAVQIGRSQPTAKKLLEAGRIPAQRIDGHWCASRTQLRKALVGDATRKAS